jgi:hypothetical protein
MRQFRFGEGCFIDLSLMRSAAAYQGAKLMEWVFSKGAPPVLYMPAGSYKTSNGYMMVSAMRPHHFRQLFELIGRQDIANDPELQGHNDRIKNAPRIIKALQETMPSKTTEEWIAILQPQDVFCERVNNYTDYLEHPHVKESGAIDWIDQERVGRLPVANIPLPPASQHPPQQHAPRSARTGPTSPASAVMVAFRSTPSSRGGIARRHRARRRVTCLVVSDARFRRPRGLPGHLKPMGEGIASSTRMVLTPCWRPQPKSRARWPRGLPTLAGSSTLPSNNEPMMFMHEFVADLQPALWRRAGHARRRAVPQGERSTAGRRRTPHFA